MKINIALLLIILILGSLASIYLGQYHWVINLFAHFQLQLLCILVVIIFYTVIKRWRDLGIIATLYSIFLISLIFPVTIFNGGEASSPEIFFQNAWIYNQQLPELSQHIRKSAPDVTAIVELPDALEQEMMQFYKYAPSLHGGGGGRCGIFANQNYPEIEYRNLEYPVCSVKTPDYQLLVIHPAPPFSQELLEKQLRHFAEISQIINKIDDRGEKFIVVGDFNSATYPDYFQQYFGDYIQANVYSWKPFKPQTIPIDHALSNFDIEVNRGSQLGSDHSALLLNL